LSQAAALFSKKGGENMGRPQPAEALSRDEPTLRVWEDMRDEVLHELQEGADVSDAVVDAMANLVATLKSWGLTKGLLTLEPSSV
jgi:hypothetical protein